MLISQPLLPKVKFSGDETVDRIPLQHMSLVRFIRHPSYHYHCPNFGREFKDLHRIIARLGLEDATDDCFSIRKVPGTLPIRGLVKYKAVRGERSVSRYRSQGLESFNAFTRFLSRVTA